MKYKWQSTGTVGEMQFRCGYCGKHVAPSDGYYAQCPPGRGYIYICPMCTCPTFFAYDGKQVPAVRLGNDVDGISDPHVEAAYSEARDCSAAGANTAVVLLCRKILMNLAVSHGAEVGESFASYVDYLEQAGYVPPNGKKWVDRIRTKGNEGTHEIPTVSDDDVSQILGFTEMLLRFSFEFQSLLKDDDAV